MSSTTRSDSSAGSAPIAVPGAASPISRVARNPPPPGIWTSTIATSGPALGGARDRLVSVAGGADDLEAVAELRDEDGADVGVVVGDEYAGPGGAPRRGVAPTAAARRCARRRTWARRPRRALAARPPACRR